MRRILGTSHLASSLVDSAYIRSRLSPRSVTYEELSSSPSIDFTGYRHIETTVPIVEVGALFTMSDHRLL